MSGNQDGPLSLDNAVSYLTASLLNPLDPNSCHLRMRVASDCISSALRACNNDSSRKKAIARYPQFLRAGMNFLTRKQSTAAHAAMVKQLCDCQCLCNFHNLEEMLALHDVPLREEDIRMPQPLQNNHHLMLVARTIVDSIASILTGITVGKFRSDSQSSQQSSNRPWPTSPEDLFPSGCVDAVDGLELWATEVGGHGIYTLATCLAGFHPPFSRATFQPPSYVFALERPLKHLDAAMDAYSSDLTNPSFCAVVSSIMAFLGYHFITSDTSASNLAILRANSQLADPIITRLWAVYSPLPRSHHVRATIAIVRDLANITTNPQTGAISIRPGHNLALLSGEVAFLNVYTSALSSMRATRRGGCSNIGCPTKESGGYAHLCTKCDLVRYCGKKVCSLVVWCMAPRISFSPLHISRRSASSRRGSTINTLTRQSAQRSIP